MVWEVKVPFAEEEEQEDLERLLGVQPERVLEAAQYFS
jgi:hypothetical protein